MGRALPPVRSRRRERRLRPPQRFALRANARTVAGLAERTASYAQATDVAAAGVRDLDIVHPHVPVLVRHTVTGLTLPPTGHKYTEVVVFK